MSPVQARAPKGVSPWPEIIQDALKKPSGARFYRCALQVNPFDYLQRHKKTTAFKDEASYNAAIIQACLELRIEVLAVTDHYRVRTAVGLQKTAQAAGLHAFPGFEAVTKDGVHFLCLFDPQKDIDSLERVLGDCGIHEHKAESPTGKYDATELLEIAHQWGAVCIAAHVASDGGILVTLKGQPRINAWKSQRLLACSLPGSVDDAPDGIRDVLKNQNSDYKRTRPVAILNAQDVDSPEAVAKPGASSWIKMSQVSMDGLQQALLDPTSRIRLNTDPPPEAHAEFVALTWETSGFLEAAQVHFNENLNVLIGGRGTGKSSVIETVRYVLGLEPLGEEARNAHEGIVRQVLRSGTKISLLVRSHHPAKRDYLIERTIPNPPIVRDDTGNVLSILPRDIIPQAEVYGQHEISELTRSREKLTRLLERFVERDPNLAKGKGDLKRELELSRIRILDIQKEIKRVEERLASLPALEETLKSFQEAGIEERLKEQSLLVREERLLNTAVERIAPFRQLLDQLHRELPIDRVFLSPKALEGLPGKDMLQSADKVIEQLGRELQDVVLKMEQALKRADHGLAAVRIKWEERRRTVQAAYEKILRELQRSKVDGEEFIRLRRQIEDLRPLRDRHTSLQRDSKEAEERRRNFLAQWQDIKAAEFRQLERAAKNVNRQLANRVRVRVNFEGNREPLYEHIRKLGGRLSEAIDSLKRQAVLSLKDLADACRSGRGSLVQKFAIPQAQADRLAQAPPEVIMEMEELDLPATTEVELNVSGEGQTPVWQNLEALSTGQKATAVLLLLLLESDAPLVVDQPEDDLDNRFITEGIVPKMREEKRRRQFLFATHNANIPVLGDAELIVGLSAAGEAERGKAQMPPEHMGSIDARPVREIVEEILEGGKEAFEMRRLKYGF